MPERGNADQRKYRLEILNGSLAIHRRRVENAQKLVTYYEAVIAEEEAGTATDASRHALYQGIVIGTNGE